VAGGWAALWCLCAALAVIINCSIGICTQSTSVCGPGHIQCEGGALWWPESQFGVLLMVRLWLLAGCAGTGCCSAVLPGGAASGCVVCPSVAGPGRPAAGGRGAGTGEDWEGGELVQVRTGAALGHQLGGVGAVEDELITQIRHWQHSTMSHTAVATGRWG
jgi:hypothetical protein